MTQNCCVEGYMQGCQGPSLRRVAVVQVFENGPQGEAVVAVPDRAVGAIIGKGGDVINQIKNVVGVRIRVSGRDEYIEGTKDRSVTITGAPPQPSLPSHVWVTELPSTYIFETANTVLITWEPNILC